MNYIKWILNMNLPLLAYETVKRWITGKAIIHKVCTNLYQSSLLSGRDLPRLKELGVDVLIDLEGERDTIPDTLPIAAENYYFWPFEDKPELPDLNGLNAVVDWGYRKWKEGHVVLTHCQAGHNRSGLVNALILVKIGLPGIAAVEYIRQRVPGALMNYVFREYVEAQK